MSDTQGQPDNGTGNDSRWSVIKEKANEVKAVKAFELFWNAGIEPVLIKGLAAAAYYPRGKFRDSIDLDLAVRESDINIAQKLVTSRGAAGLAIDLHRGLRHLDTLSWDDLFARSKIVPLEGGEIRTLCAEDHLRVISTHWLTDGGANKERLWDIYYAVENRPPTFDWQRALDSAGKHRRRWVVLTILMAHRALGLDISDTPIASEVDTMPDWFIRTVESEWASETPFRPLFASMSNWQTFRDQLKKRLPPNPITATVLLNGSLDARTRVFYQVGTSLARIAPSIWSAARELVYRSR